VRRKKHSSKSIEWHKRRILARLTPKNAPQNLIIMQHVGQWTGNGFSSLIIRSTDKNGTDHTHGMVMTMVTERCKVIRALRYLVEENKIKSNLTTKEWDIQNALGTATRRTFQIA